MEKLRQQQKQSLVEVDVPQIAQKYGIEKIKTIGDSYMVVAGFPEAKEDQCSKSVSYG